jgi:ATP-dependent Clp protease ATP-binding subunit ClpX
MNEPKHPKCSFCGKGPGEVGRMLAGPSIAICDECVLLAAEIVGEGRPEWCDTMITKVEAIRRQ